MLRRLSLWSSFAVCLAVVLAAMGWISAMAIRADRAETKVRRLAAAEENCRLALWQMDTWLSPLLAEENARPYYVYRSFFAANGSGGRLSNAVDAAGFAGVPSPLLQNTSPYVLLHFQCGPDGRLTSPESPSEADRTLAMPKYISTAQADRAKRRLDDLAAFLKRDRLATLLPAHTLPRLDPARPLLAQQSPQTSQANADREFQRRNEALLQNSNGYMQSQQQLAASNSPLLNPTAAMSEIYDTSGVLMTPLWLDGRLLLARRFTAGGRETL